MGVLTFGDKTEKLQWVWGFGKAGKDQIGFFNPLDLCEVYFRLIMNQGQNRYFEDVFIWGERDTLYINGQIRAYYSLNFELNMINMGWQLGI